MKRSQQRVWTALTLWLAIFQGAQAKEGVGSRDVESPPQAVLSEEQRKEVDYKLRAAQEFADRGYFDAAVVNLLEVIKADPTNVPASDLLTKVLVRMGNWALTIKTLQNLVSLDPKNPKYPRLLVQVSQAYDMPLQETAALEKLVKLEPNNPDNFVQLGALYTRLYRPQDAVNAYLSANALKPGNPQLLKDLAEAYQATGDVQARIATTEQLAALEPTERNRNELARLQLDSDAPRVALGLYEKLAADYPTDPDYKESAALSLFEIGQSYYDHELYSRALDYYNQAEARGLQDDRLPGAKDKANTLLNPVLQGNFELGRTGRNNLQYYDASFELPVRVTDFTLGVTESWRRAADAGLNTVGALQLTKVTGDYKFWEDWKVSGMFGTSRKGDVGGFSADVLSGGLQATFGYIHDFVYETPRSINTGLDYNSFYGQFQYAIDPRWSAGAEIYTYDFSNHNNALLTDFSVGYALLLDPDRSALTLRASRSDFHNKFEEDILLRFGPKFLGESSIGLGWQERISEHFRYNLDYVSTWTDNGVQLSSYRAAIDYNFGLGCNLFLDYELGANPRGVINAGSFNNRNDQKFTGGVHFTF